MLCLDVRMLHSSGIGTYLQGLLGGLKKANSSRMALCLLGNTRQLPKGPWSVADVRSRIYTVREQLEIPRVVKRRGGHLLHTPHYNLPLSIASRTVVTVHDLIHLKFPHYWPSLA